jgi:hypothetical protein
LLEAIAAGKSAVAAQRASQLTLINPTRWLAEPSQIDDPFVAQDSPLNRSRVGQLVRRIATDLSRSNIAGQGHLGSEAVLSERYAAARSTLRRRWVLEDARTRYDAAADMDGLRVQRIGFCAYVRCATIWPHATR